MTRAGSREAALLALLVGGMALAATSAQAGDFRGRVVDGSTGESLEGAVVVVTWFRGSYQPGLVERPPDVPYKTVEKVSGANGEFSVDVSPGVASPNFAHRNVVIFKPGYYLTSKGTDHKSEPLFPQELVTLRKIETREDPRKYRDPAELLSIGLCHDPEPNFDTDCVHLSAVPNLVRVLEINKRMYQPNSSEVFGLESDE